jgi:hypothetical protein
MYSIDGVHLTFNNGYASNLQSSLLLSGLIYSHCPRVIVHCTGYNAQQSTVYTFSSDLLCILYRSFTPF